MRVNLEERFFAESSRWRSLARLMGWYPNHAKGFLGTLWHGSQAVMETHGDIDEICAWGEEFDDPQKLIDCLCHKTVRYLISCPNGRFEIVGNDEQIDGFKKHRALKSKAGKASAAKRKATAVQQPFNTRSTDVQQNPTNAIQCNAMQSNTIQIKKREIKDARSDSPPAQTTPPINSDLKLGDPVPEKKRKRKASTQKPRIKAWEPDNRFARSFTLLNTLEPYRACFDVPTDSAKLESHMDQYKLSVVDLDKQIYDFTHYYKDVVHKLQNPRGRLTTWLANRARWKQEHDDKQLPMSAKEKKIRLDEMVDKRARDALTQEQRDNPFESAYQQRRNKPF